YAWLSSSPVPTLTLEPGDKQDITEDGLYLVKVNESVDTLICIDTSSEVEIWRTYIVTSVGIYNGIDISEDGSRVLVSFYDAGNGARVYDMTDGSMVGEPVGNYGQTMARISGDGSRFITGDFNARIKLYEYNGTLWDLAANIASGDEWVRSVAISSDGETLSGGTWEDSPAGGKVIAIDWPQGGSPSVLWEYTNYGDNVSSVAICEDGSRIVAGCYGRWQGTFGDVFTAFDRSGDVILSLLDDIDEPGSIYSVSVSSDGCYATASGKAVHAYTSGNGGEVYSINLTSTGIEETPFVPRTCWMGEPYPNPTTSLMSVEYLIPRTGGTVDLAIYDINGRRVATLNSETAPGEHVSVWNLKSDSGELSSTGLYFIRLSAPGTVITRKILIVN
ncbi:MAG: T9SS type A sorting domain-containing protein, partial [Candidatus Aegiribacteria sp.]|nr:T9SS type A sorting domain-containing protein [Candidatus Aegiribacteria sp.]